MPTRRSIPWGPFIGFGPTFDQALSQLFFKFHSLMRLFLSLRSPAEKMGVRNGFTEHSPNPAFYETWVAASVWIPPNGLPFQGKKGALLGVGVIQGCYPGLLKVALAGHHHS